MIGAGLVALGLLAGSLPASGLPSEATSSGDALPAAGIASPADTTEGSPPAAAYAGMRWRQVGPFRAGWASMAVGVPGSPDHFYFGGAGGGVWETRDAGRTWKPYLQHAAASAIGALAVAPSDSEVLYAGTGQVTMRYDDMAGDGMYRSEDGGHSWRHVGLRETRHIGAILVAPDDANRVLVAALGHAFGPNPERGVYLTTDGGRSWRRTLHVDDRTGAVDLAQDPAHPEVVYAATWQMHLHPWLDYFQPTAGPGSWIWRSDDAGEHWSKVAGKGLPAGPLGRIGVGVAAGSAGRIVYAAVEAPGGGGGFYRSEDGGGSWTLTDDDPELAGSYFSRVTPSPVDPQVVYVMGRSIHRSEDGGRHFTIVKGSPGGDDYHYLWIDPEDPDRMITGADQGAAVTVDGGRTWSSWYNQPTGQFYHLAADDRFPYRIYSGQQDNGTVMIRSRGPYGVIEERDWHPVGGDERDYMVPKPGDPETVFGSGLGGHVSRFDEETRQVAEVSPWPVNTYGVRPTTARYRYTWITPLVFGALGSRPMYLGAQVLFRSDDDGDSWRTVSPDLSGKGPGAAHCDGNPTLDEARACGYGVVYSIGPSPVDSMRLWVGTDDGKVRLTTDGGASWKDVTPRQVPAWGRIDAAEPSPFDRGEAYLAVDLHRLDRFEPMLLRTTDAGRSWTRIDAGLPRDEYTTVVRADPGRRGLLYAGTNRSVYVSFDDGGHWQPLTLNFPTTWVRDLLVHRGDLVAATQGRGIWVLDDLAPLREADASVASEPVHLFRPATALRVRRDENRDTPPPPSTPLGRNPPPGAILDYWLKEPARGPVTLEIRDSTGALVRRFSSERGTEELPATRYFQPEWVGPGPKLEKGEGMHRFTWDLRYRRPPALSYSYTIAAVWDADELPLQPEGPLVLPGHYTVVLEANGQRRSRSLDVELDPRVHPAPGALRAQLDLARGIDSLLARAVAAHRRVEQALKAGGGKPEPGMDSLRAVADGAAPSLASVAGVLASLATAVQSADAAPTRGERRVFEEYRRQLEGLLDRTDRLLQNTGADADAATAP